jgi:hypothetical protein
MFNLEMIGTESKWGFAYITGFENQVWEKYSKNLEGSAFKFYPDPYPEQQFIVPDKHAT